MTITFFGAASTVTGSKHVIDNNGYKILLDCGLHQGRRREAYELNRRLPFEATELQSVILSHAHADHCGALPLLYNHGYRGTIYATPATADIARLIMLDSAKLQASDYEHLVQQGIAVADLMPPLYTVEEVEQTAKLWQTVGYARQQAG